MASTNEIKRLVQRNKLFDALDSLMDACISNDMRNTVISIRQRLSSVKYEPDLNHKRTVESRVCKHILDLADEIDQKNGGNKKITTKSKMPSYLRPFREQQAYTMGKSELMSVIKKYKRYENDFSERALELMSQLDDYANQKDLDDNYDYSIVLLPPLLNNIQSLLKDTRDFESNNKIMIFDYCYAQLEPKIPSYDNLQNVLDKLVEYGYNDQEIIQWIGERISSERRQRMIAEDFEEFLSDLKNKI